jgi:glycosyltransferase involved in cell wall biosynthesis
LSVRASVVLRSCNRIESALEALEHLQGQDYPSFEIVVVEQTEQMTPEQAHRLAALEGDPRIRIIRSRPLGGAGARNEGVRHSHGEILVLLDDDDFPASTRWLSDHVRNYEDPRCLAVTGRLIVPGGREPPYWNMERARRLVLTYTPLMWPRCYTRTDRRSTRCQNMLGSNASVRRSAIERFGLWDECTRVEDEASFCYRMLAGKTKEEYLVFDPDAAIVRRLDIPGGLDKRTMTMGEYGRAVFDFFHNIVAHYYPVRFVLLYPGYVAMLAFVSIEWVLLGSRRYPTVWQKALAVAGVIVMLPFRWGWWLGQWAARRIRIGAPIRYSPF